jgi:dienelactone hydrolase
MIETLLNTTVAGQRLQGTLCLPQGGPSPCVLMLHGFTGSRDEQVIEGIGEGVFSRTARRWAARGMASLRIDFRGSSFLHRISGGGGSEGDFADTTYEGQVADAFAAWEALVQDPRVTPVAVLGWSQGGLVAATFAGRSASGRGASGRGASGRGPGSSPGQPGASPRATALWAAVADPKESFSGLLGPEGLTRGLASEGPHRVDLSWGKTVHLKRGYFQGVMTNRPTEEIARYPGPLFVAHGTRDDAVAPHAADQYLAAHKGPHQAWIAEMDHSFNANQGAEMLDRLADATLDFVMKSIK